MASRGKESIEKSSKVYPRCLAIADEGIETGKDFAQLMSALIGDIAADRIDAQRANAICNAGGKLLRIVELEHRYRSSARKNDSELRLSPPIMKRARASG